MNQPPTGGMAFKASNGEVFTGLPFGVERIWWVCGAEDRIANAVMPVHQSLPYLEEAFEAGWKAMDKRLEARTA